MRLGPVHVSMASGRPRRRSPGGPVGGYLQLVVLVVRLCVWACVVTAVTCWWLARLAWAGGVWLAGVVAGRRQQRLAVEAARQEAAARAAQQEHERLVASLRPEDVAFLRQNGWQAPASTAHRVSTWA
jgi:hypothetical protein